ncbi:MAG TPA: NAD(P)-dependent oxidoreductase [Anaerolineaceae bacterium]|mgnify:CR=1 FL=1|nr:NAD(P)-dependent oxidoreductase [Anaerolineaceae bacterium]
MAKMRIGYIGLGTMGAPMAMNILKAGFPLTVFNRTTSKAADLIAAGAQWADTPAEVASRTEIVFTNLSDTPDVLQILFGANGVIDGAHPDMILVDNSTIKPSASREIYQRFHDVGVKVLDAPVSGGDIGAKNGTLAIMVGGDSEALEKAMPVLEAIGKKITHVGDAGAGQVAKAANQIMVAAQMVAEAELMLFAQKSGVDVAKVIEAIKGGAAQCWTLDVKPQRLLAGNRTPGFKSSLQAKDLNIVIDTARDYQAVLPGTALNSQLFNGLVALGEGHLDNSAVIHMLELLNNTDLQTTE